MYYEDPVHGIDKEQLRELLIGIANGIMPDTYGLKLIKLHKCSPRVLREMRLCREAGMTGDQIRPYWVLGIKKLREVRAAFLKKQIEGDTGIPNEETQRAIQEVQRMKENPGLCKTYTDVNQFLQDALSDE